jgi:pimeloyl-ACP methyl ester carboxylesterase
VLWPELDPLFPPAWSDRLGEFYADFELQRLVSVGHFVPLEAPDTVAEATVRALRR